MNNTKRPKNGEQTIHALKRQLEKSKQVYRFNYDFLKSFSDAHGVRNYRVQTYLCKYQKTLKTIDRLLNLLE